MRIQSSNSSLTWEAFLRTGLGEVTIKQLDSTLDIAWSRLVCLLTLGSSTSDLVAEGTSLRWQVLGTKASQMDKAHPHNPCSLCASMAVAVSVPEELLGLWSTSSSHISSFFLLPWLPPGLSSANHLYGLVYFFLPPDDSWTHWCAAFASSGPGYQPHFLPHSPGCQLHWTPWSCSLALSLWCCPLL